MATCRVPHLQAKHNYEAAATLLGDLAKVGDKKKNYSKALGALRLLLHCRVSDALRPSLLELSSFKDPSIQRLALYFLGYPPTTTALRIPAAGSALQLDQGEKQSLAKKVASLRTLSHVVPTDDVNATSFIADLAASVLKETEGSDKKLKKKEEELLQQKKVMRYAIMSTLRQGFIPSGDVLISMLNCLESCDDGATARHIMAVTLRFAKDPSLSQSVAENLRRHMPQFDDPAAAVCPVLAEDVFARVYLVRLFAHFADPSHLQANEGLAGEFYQALCHYASDKSLKVCLEAISCLASLSWTRLAQEELKPHRESITHLYVERNPTVLFNLQKRLISSLATKGPTATPTILAATRVATELAKTYILCGTANKDSVHPLEALVDPFTVLLKSATDQVRLKVLKLFAWLIHPRESHVLREILLKEWNSNTLSPKMCDEVIETLYERVLETPNTIPMVLDLVYLLATRRPEHFRIELVVRIWMSIMEGGSDGGRSRVQRNVFDILDFHNTPAMHGTMQRIHCELYWFLGETGHVLADRGAGDLTPDTPTLKSILLRMKSAAVFATWETRTVCIEGLAKIAFRSTNSVRADVTAFIAATGKESHVGSAAALVDLLEKTVDFSVNGDSNGLKALAKEVSLFCELTAPLQ